MMSEEDLVELGLTKLQAKLVVKGAS